jgi:sialidase-1
MTIAFIGGSVTQGARASAANVTSYRALTCRLLEHRFRQSHFRFINAAIGGTDSVYGAYRLKEDVFKRGDPDLLFVEFAVNDAGNRIESVRAMEGIVRQARRINPQIDICFIYVASQEGAKRFHEEGKMQENIYNHEAVAEYYGLPSVCIAGEIYRMMEAGMLRWDEISADQVHPNDFGYSLYARFLQDFLKKTLYAGDKTDIDGSPLPLPMDPFCYEHADLLSVQSAQNLSGWRWIQNWTFEHSCLWELPSEILFGEMTGASFQIRFHGTAVGFSMLAGTDLGNVDCSIDGGEFRTVQLFDPKFPFFRPKIVLLADGLLPGVHTADVRISEENHIQSIGQKIRIFHLMVNGIGR